ncbi:uncharacterized protein [Parasteatoda tepidariorum]|uniref:uncharacterized protein n=1 Tax=Parasteatoda tepidariorum TaxID=114398 RepID=UPI00077FAF60|nr:glyoxylate/succinic semialdehyde reductase 1 [Parasteatoda tepidariorum]XP_015929603.1 glyoxylate/succinic semialdehyde reductase 1 [Parasteatoda tepidariorum]XP_015929604.1 glyoxylate/succinic semialdehyde reductase 1 [Parasteatoda tepidariorum]
MVGKDLDIGDLVWAKMKGYPPWPSRVMEPPTKHTHTKKNHHYVKFFGTKNYAWIEDDKIFPHSDDMIDKTSKKKPGALVKAIEEIVDEYKTRPPKKKPQEVIVSSPLKSKVPDTPKKSEKVKVKKSGLERKEKSEKKISRKRSAESNHFDDYSSLKIAKPSFRMTDKSISTADSSESHSTFSSSILQRRTYVDCPQTPPLDIKTIKETLLVKNVKPTSKKIGFLGLNALGQGIVKNLLNSGHNVTVWNQLPILYEEFSEAGAQIAQTPADVIENCDITFCCVTDPQETKRLVFENCGILKGLEGCTSLSKGYVELTGIDPETSKEIAKEISCKGGRYIEAPVTGSRSQAEDGQLVVLAAGDQELFNQCQSCFSAFSKHAYFVSLHIGYASKMSLALSMFKGTVVAALAEALTLINKCKLCPDTFLAILDLICVNSQMLQEKGKAMKDREYTPDVPLNSQDKDLGLALALADSLNQPLPLSGQVKEIFKRAKLRCYGDHDVSAVIEGTRFS